jgi:hypothetical protein
MEGKEVTGVMKKLLVFCLALAMVAAFCLQVLAQDKVTGRIQVLDTAGRKITISGTEYLLSDEAAQTKFKVGDDVEATVEGNVVKKLARLLQ